MCFMLLAHEFSGPNRFLIQIGIKSFDSIGLEKNWVWLFTVQFHQSGWKIMTAHFNIQNQTILEGFSKQDTYRR